MMNILGYFCDSVKEDVDSSKEEVDEGFQEVAARPSRGNKRCSTRQQYHALECCHIRVNGTCTIDTGFGFSNMLVSVLT